MRLHFFCSVCLLAFMSACATSEQASTDAHIADVALKNGSPDAALRIARQRLDKHPDDVLSLGLQGDAEYALGRMAQANASYARVLALDPKDRRGLLGIGRVSLPYDPAKSEDYFRRLLKYYPNDLDALNNLGIALDARGEHLSAQKLYRRVIAQDPEASSTVINLGLSLTLSDQADEALQYLKPLSLGSENNTRVKGNTALALIVAGRSNEAQALLKSYLSEANAKKTMLKYQEISDKIKRR